MRMTFWADPAVGHTTSFTHHQPTDESGTTPGYEEAVVLDVAEFDTWNEAKRHSNELAGFDPDTGLLDHDFPLVLADDELLT